MFVVLFRHGPAARPDAARWPEDRDRPLTADGAETVAAAARGLRALLASPPAIVTSPYLRALQTAEILRHELDAVACDTRAALASGCAPATACEEIAQHDPGTPLVVVGHEPDLGVLAGFLTEDGRLPFEPAGACAIELADPPGKGAGRLIWHVPPDVLRRAAEPA